MSPDNQNARPELNSEGRAAVDAYLGQILRKWLTVLGIVNIGVIATSLWYVFAILPDKAYSHAELTIERRVAGLVERLNDAAADALIKSGRADGLASQAERDIAELRKRLDVVGGAISGFETSDAKLISDALGSLKDGSNAGDAIRSLATVKGQLDVLVRDISSLQESNASVRQALLKSLDVLANATHEIAERGDRVATHPPYKEQMNTHSTELRKLRENL